MFHNIHKKKRDNRFPISLTLCSVLGVFMVNGSADNDNDNGLCSNGGASAKTYICIRDRCQEWISRLEKLVYMM